MVLGCYDCWQVARISRAIMERTGSRASRDKQDLRADFLMHGIKVDHAVARARTGMR
jgi:hypothetical protein